ncbi:FtsX-like permease family protein [Enterococcus faecalis]|nr:FtsX-like permease family protein [Enterococcus faecalis]
MLENIILSLESILAHKLRSILTMIGIIIGIGSIVAIFSIVEGNTENTKKSMLGGNNNSLSLKYDTKENLNGEFGGQGKKPDYIEPFSLKQRQEMQHTPNVKDATFTYDKETELLCEDKNTDINFIGITDNYFDYENYTLTKGRLFNSTDYASSKQMTILDEELYNQLFPEDNGLGKLVEIKGMAYQIIGIVKKKDNDSSGGFLSFGVQAPKAFTSYQNWTKYMGTLNPIPTVMVKTERADDLQKAAQAVANKLNRKMPKSDYIFGIYNSKEVEKQIDEYAKSQFQLLGGIASISLLVGGIGVMNIMLVSVTERTREIGIKKALGARRKVILQQFLLESIVLTLAGGILGISLGLIGGKIATGILGYPYYISLFAILASLLFSTMIGLIFGLLPAVKASKLEPVEALHYE